LGVTGGIAAYKSILLARELTLAGARVPVVLTTAALEFVTPLSFEALTGQPVHSRMYTPGDPLLHIRLAREADLVVIAPATANFIARAAAGSADDLLAAILLATGAPVLVAPAMNDRMYAHPQTQANLARLQQLGYTLSGPDEGPLAFGEGEGKGRMLEPAVILDEIARALTGSSPLDGKRVLVTAGPTREPIDPVRFLGNRSSGRMGFAVAREAYFRGADVVLVTGPSDLPTPTGVRRLEIETASQMAETVGRELPSADVLVMAAAVADFAPAEPAAEKIKKERSTPSAIALARTPDILRETFGMRRAGAVVVGFALETERHLENARRKLLDKKLDLLVLNDAREPGAGFEVETNRVTLLDAQGGVADLPLLSKAEVAGAILDRVADLLRRGEG
jgi:phosphopantothenoylcysteine decarboxylase / phosphopantothenate---cysteine ligase